MMAKTASEKQLRRTNALCQRVKLTGNQGFEYFLIADHTDLHDANRRPECEAYLFGWFAASSTINGWADWNTERVRKTLRPIYEQGLCAAESRS